MHVRESDALFNIAGRVLMERSGRPEELANAVTSPTSDESSFVTGHLLLVHGGNIPQ